MERTDLLDRPLKATPTLHAGPCDSQGPIKKGRAERAIFGAVHFGAPAPNLTSGRTRRLNLYLTRLNALSCDGRTRKCLRPNPLRLDRDPFAMSVRVAMEELLRVQVGRRGELRL